MADVARVVRTSFWTSKLAMEVFSAEDMYFMLYLMTNPHTTQLGIYPISKKYMALEFKHSIESIESILDRFENKYELIKYSKATNEVAIKNYLESSIIKGGKPVEDCLIKEIKAVKDKSLLDFVYQYISKCEELNDTVKDILHLLNQNSNTNNYSNTNNKETNDNDNERIVVTDSSNTKKSLCQLSNIHKDVIAYLNQKAGTFYRYTTRSTQEFIRARQNEGFTLQDFYDVIDIKCLQWKDNTKMSRYLRPETLFNPQKFEGYLNEAKKQKFTTADVNASNTPPDSDYDENGVRIRSR